MAKRTRFCETFLVRAVANSSFRLKPCNYFPTKERVIEVAVEKMYHHFIKDLTMDEALALLNSKGGERIVAELKPTIQGFINSLMKEESKKNLKLKVHCSTDINIQDSMSSIPNILLELKYQNIEVHFGNLKRGFAMESLIKKVEYKLRIPSVEFDIAVIPVAFKIKPIVDYVNHTMSIATMFEGGKLFNFSATAGITSQYSPFFSFDAKFNLGSLKASLSLTPETFLIKGRASIDSKIGLHIAFAGEPNQGIWTAKASSKGFDSQHQVTISPSGIIILGIKNEVLNSGKVTMEMKFDLTKGSFEPILEGKFAM